MNINKILLTFLISCFMSPVFAAESQKSDSKTVDEIMALVHRGNETPCASKIFSNALSEHSNEISEYDPESKVRAWAKTTFQDENVLINLLKCPEVQNVSDTETIVFSPVQYEFTNGRTITINYDTQPKILKQKLMLARKPSLPNGEASPKLMDPNDPAKYLNTEPAWYAIMVVQHDSVSDFVGPGKNNTLSLKYIDDNIKSIYPKGYFCTSKSAIANDRDTINQVVHNVVGMEDKDSNDYYVAGDVNLEWVMYAEVTAEVILSLATAGASEMGLVALKSARAGRTGMRLAKNMGKFKKFAHVQDYIKTANKIAKNTEKAAKMEKNIKNAKKYEKALKNLENAKKSGKDVAKYEKELKNIFESAKKIDPDITEDALKSADKLSDNTKNLRKEIDAAEDALKKTMENNKKLLKQKQKDLKTARKKANQTKVKEYDKQYKELNSLRDKVKDEKNLSEKAKLKNDQIKKRIDDLEKSIKNFENSDDVGDYAKLRNEVDGLESVDKYIDAEKQFKEVADYAHKLRATKRKQTGNIITRSLKTLHASNNGAKTMTTAGEVARAGMSSRSVKIGDWLMDNTLKHGARLARFERDVGLLNTAAIFLLDMYDKTSATSKEFSNGIEFKPLCLLSADDLEGQDNVVNYGMWLMWMGSSDDAADDDAAYLQAMDFASKFYYQLDEFQDKNGANCNVDIYVVRPIIRLDETNTDDPHGEMFYLFMNEIPWTTAKQFGEQIPDIEDWERTQKTLEEQNPENRYNDTPDNTDIENPEQIAADETPEPSDENSDENDFE